jgi:hypothetical protein
VASQNRLKSQPEKCELADATVSAGLLLDIHATLAPVTQNCKITMMFRMLIVAQLLVQILIHESTTWTMQDKLGKAHLALIWPSSTPQLKVRSSSRLFLFIHTWYVGYFCIYFNLMFFSVPFNLFETKKK